jgi:hypothetical protein
MDTISSGESEVFYPQVLRYAKLAEPLYEELKFVFRSFNQFTHIIRIERD